MKKWAVVKTVLLVVGLVLVGNSLSYSTPKIKMSGGEEEGFDKKAPLYFFGYGELHYNNRVGNGGDQFDFHRLVLGLGYDFTDKWILRTELDFEHAFQEPELEFAHIDYLKSPPLNFRFGSLLVPIGVINQHHEPPLFYSVERPEVYRVIIPTTWQEGGAGVYGEITEGLHYQLYGTSSLNASGFNGSNGVRGGRGHVGEQIGRDFAGSGRLEYVGLPGFRLGTSLFAGNTGQGDATIDGGFLVMSEGDAKYSIEGFDLEGLFVWSHLSDAGNVNTALVAATPTFSNFVASQMMGWYFEGAYHLFHHLKPESRQDLLLFSRFEDFNTQYRMPAGFAASAANDRNTVTTGLAYLPIPQIAFKADYMLNWNQANGGSDQFNLGVGFYY